VACFTSFESAYKVIIKSCDLPNKSFRYSFEEFVFSEEILQQEIFFFPRLVKQGSLVAKFRNNLS